MFSIASTLHRNPFGQREAPCNVCFPSLVFFPPSPGMTPLLSLGVETCGADNSLAACFVAGSMFVNGGTLSV